MKKSQLKFLIKEVMKEMNNPNRLTIDSLIQQLQKIKSEQGNLPVEITVAEYYEGDTFDAREAIVQTNFKDEKVVKFG